MTGETVTINPPATNVVVRAVDISKTYHMDDGVQVQAVRNISLDVIDSEFLIIMGDSGSGKSTLLYLLSGMEPLSGGSVEILDQRINEMNEREQAIFRREHMGFIFQNINLLHNMTVKENVLFPALLLGKKEPDIKDELAGLFSKMGLEAQENKLPSQMSGGQQQRAAIVRALINKPQILFADEPTGNLNSSNGLAVIEILQQLNKEGQTIVMVTHDYKLASYGDRVLYIRDGAILSEHVNDKSTSVSKRETVILEWLQEKGW